MIEKLIKKYQNDCVESYEWYEIVKDLQAIKAKIERMIKFYDMIQLSSIVDDLKELLGGDDADNTDT
jgi:hypothetical protein